MDPLPQIQSALAGRYTVERELGRGGMATVFLARDIRHARPVAVKVMTADVLAQGGTERFLREIGIAARLTHPHVLGVHDSGEASGLLYYVMPYAEGETLRARITREGALPLGDVLRLLRELADALAYAHAQGVVHRDLKPENVLLSGGHAVIADFGIAKAVAAATQDGGANAPALTGTGIAMGTPAYMAPEQAIGDRSADHRADLYALGVIAYEMISGAHPFGTRSAQGFAAAHLAESAAPVTSRRGNVPRELGDLVARLLAKEPGERPQSAADVVRALDAVSGSQLAAPAPSNSRRWLAIAAALVVIVAGAAYALRARIGGGPRTIRMVAVMPFVNISGNKEDEYFSDGMTDELAHALTRLNGLQVAGRTGSYSFKGKSATPQEIGKALGSDALVEGTVRRGSDDRLRVSVELVSTADGKVMWDSVYESRSTDVFGVQDQFTRAVVAAIAPTLAGRPPVPAIADVGRGTTDPDAYQLYLQGRYYFFARGETNVRKAIDYYKQAIARDQKFARAHAGLALAYNVLTVYVPDPRDTVPRLIEASTVRALALDSTLADAQIAAAASSERNGMRFADATAHYRRAVAIEPANPTAHQAFGYFLMNIGHLDEAIAEEKRSIQLDPLVPSAGTALGMALAHARRGEESAVATRRVLAMLPTFALAHKTLAMAHQVMGHPDSALLSLEATAKYAPGGPGFNARLLFAYAVLGRWDDLKRLRAQLTRPGAERIERLEAAYADFLLGDPEPFVHDVTSAPGMQTWYAAYTFGCNPLLDPVWSDRRFRAAMEKVGIATCTAAKVWPGVPRHTGG